MLSGLTPNAPIRLGLASRIQPVQYKEQNSSRIMAAVGNATAPMGISEAEIVMVAERAVTQGLNDLRGELGVKFHEIENGGTGMKFLQSKLSDLEDEISNLSDSVTTAFKNKNQLLRNEIRAMKGDIAQ